VTFAELLADPNVVEECELRGAFGFMAFHGGWLEEATDVIARAAAERVGASYYGVLWPPESPHLSSIKFDPEASSTLARFLDHVDTVITVHGYGRVGYWSTLLAGGSNRDLATHLAGHVRAALPAYTVIDEIDLIPTELRGLHPNNPVNRPRLGGVQIELPPRVRGNTPMFWDWEGPGPCPHTARLIDAFVDATNTWLQAG
jgi:phage replication-related protein YjqB (UPF0714/DUF867 family)